MDIDLENLQLRFFTSYSGVKLPLKLVTPLTDAELHNRNTFFRGYFDNREQLIVCQNVVYGEVELEHHYIYYPNGNLQRAEITDVEGEVTLLNFDENGLAIEAD